MTIQIEHRYPYIYEMCREYEVSAGTKPDFTVCTSNEKIQLEFEAYERLYQHTLDFEDWKGLCEHDSLMTYLCDRLSDYGAFLMHAAVVAVDGVAYIFTAPSGTGKTTHILLWKQHFGDRAVILNGDKPIIRILDGKVYVCGTPWKGKEGFGLGPGVMLPVGGVCVVEQNPENHIRKLSVSEAIRAGAVNARWCPQYQQTERLSASRSE